MCHRSSPFPTCTCAKHAPPCAVGLCQVHFWLRAMADEQCCVGLRWAGAPLHYRLRSRSAETGVK